MPKAELLAPPDVACVPKAAALAPAADAPNPAASASAPVAVGKAKALALLPSIGNLAPNAFSCETLTASVAPTPAATLTIRRSAPTAPTDTTLATPPSVEPAPRKTPSIPVVIAWLP